MFNITLLISILLHYSYIKTIKLLPTDTLNSKIVPVCEFKPYLVYAEKKYVTIEEKTSQTFSWANSVIINICFLFL